MKYIFLGIAIMFCVSLTFSKGNENTQFYYYKGKKDRPTY